MNYFEKALAEHIGYENLLRIQSFRIGIAGAGGLGSNCAFNLVRSGFKHLLIVDFDIVDFSNLNRQFYFYNQIGYLKVDALKENLLSINPDLDIKTFKMFIDNNNVEEIFSDCDIIVEAFDKAAYKKMIIEELISSKRLIVCASGLAGWGKSDQIMVNRIKNNIYIVGDLVSEVGVNKPPISPRVNICAAKQADIVLDYVLGICNHE
jgi:sulfur carrier protein ThiS adenylyltransferase